MVRVKQHARKDNEMEFGSVCACWSAITHAKMRWLCKISLLLLIYLLYFVIITLSMLNFDFDKSFKFYSKFYSTRRKPFFLYHPPELLVIWEFGVNMEKKICDTKTFSHLLQAFAPMALSFFPESFSKINLIPPITHLISF